MKAEEKEQALRKALLQIVVEIDLSSTSSNPAFMLQCIRNMATKALNETKEID